MEEALHINSLPNEVLLHIFGFCDINDIGRLARTCHQLHNLIMYAPTLWLEKSRYVLGSNMKHPEMRKRCKPSLPFITRCQLSKSWKNGIGQLKIGATYSRCLPWMFLEQDYLYFSKGQDIERVSRQINGKTSFGSGQSFRPKSVDITKFTITDSEAIIAFTNGILGRWEKNELHSIDCFPAHENEIHSVDSKRDIIITGSRDENIKIWKSYPEKTELKKAIKMEVRVLSTAIMPSNRHFIAGMPGVRDVHPLHLFDLESCESISSFGEGYQRGAGILGIYPENEHTFLCCGYDTTVQLWDVRCCGSSSQKWRDPFDNSIYCVTSDHNVTIVSGASRHGVVHIWDKRSSTCAHVFHINYFDSPVYSIAFDASHIFASMQRGIAAFSFTI